MNAWGYTLVKPIVKLLFYILYRPTIKGRENIPKKGPFVLAGNHTKWLDSVMLVSVTPKNQVHFLAKEELWHGKGWIVVKAMGCIPVNRKIHDKDALIIIAGACQSYYEMLLVSGANFASSPKRLNIHALDPVYIASLTASENVKNYVDIEKIIDKTSHKQGGMGGIDTKGVARRIFPIGG